MYVVEKHTDVGDKMNEPKLTKLELLIMEALWTQGRASIREIQETFPEKDRPAYTTIQTTVYRMEGKKALRRVKKVGNFHVFEAAVSRDAAQRKLIDDLLGLFGGSTQPVMAHLIESGKLTLDDVKEAEKLLRQLGRKEKSK
jgi:BlaI family penicillinase repressor